jgi:probable HAF family extracellular repeat protein
MLCPARIRLRVLGAVAAALLPLTTVGPATATMPPAANPDVSDDLAIGFVLDRGRFDRIDLPGNGGATALSGITNRGTIIGKAPDEDGVGFDALVGDRQHGFQRFDYPRAMGTYATKANERGVIVGAANRDFPSVGNPAEPGTFGYRLDRSGFTRIAFPRAVTTQAFDVNNRDQVVGEYVDRNGVYHGYRWKNGRFTTFDGPRGALGASITGINDRGDMVGMYITADGVRGFVLRDGSYTTFGALGQPLVLLPDINNRGRIAGTATDLVTEAHGFLLARGVKGPVTRIDVPRASDTFVFGLDDRGRLVGVAGDLEAVQGARAADRPPLDTLPLGLAETT